LKACGNTQSLDKGRQIHEFVANQGLLEKDIMVGNAVIDMYVKCGELARAQQVLDGLHIRDIVSWSAMISGYAQQGQGHEALNCFERMQTEGLSPNMITFICCLRACGFLGDAQKGQEIHRAIMQKGLLGADVMLGNALVDMYAKCGKMSKAQQVLEELPVRDVDTWAAIIAGYAQQEEYQEALGSLEKMRGEGISPNASIFTCILKICGAIGDIDKGEEIHSEVASRGLLKKDIVLGTSMVDMYARCGFLSKAQQVLGSLHGRDVVSWNALLSAYAQEGQSQEALKCFESMQFEGVRPNAITFTCILKVCASIGAIDKGKQIHELIVHSGLLKTDIILGNTLVDMYAKCGLLDKAQKLHKELPVRSVVSWSAIIVGYANQGQGQEAFDCFKQMKKDGFNPDGVTILSLLSACGHSGLLDEAQVLFGNMVQEYGITPSVDHQTCMVVALGSAGYFDKAVSVIKAMPYSDYLQVWVVLLGTCKKWGNVKLGMLAFDQAIQLDCSCAAGHAIMSTIFAAAGLHEDAEKVEALRLKYAS
jgi:pentatricopeptide repeat protein